eukprot:GILK01005955.1.p1 GENE.GILK01005955.1~~GILK01005955.1.p1  ORF type:complete len:151 (+),score=27.91 GILK01005955.1:43-495(+)
MAFTIKQEQTKKEFDDRTINEERKVFEKLLEDELLNDLPKDVTLEELERHIALEKGEALAITVRKLNDETITVIVPQTATVEQLKKILEKDIARREEPAMFPRKISWRYVWKNFCLNFMGYRMLDDKAKVMELGIRNQSEITFARYRGAS